MFGRLGGGGEEYAVEVWGLVNFFLFVNIRVLLSVVKHEYPASDHYTKSRDIHFIVYSGSPRKINKQYVRS